jgi:hypothetical protein
VDGEGWEVWEGGRTGARMGNTGTGAPLLHLIFARAAEPGRPLRELLTTGNGIAHLEDAELVELLASARAYQERQGRREVFPDTRRKGGKGM